jgi:hypothetical protein
MKKHSLDRIIELEKSLEIAKTENLENENLRSENFKLAEKVKNFEELKSKNDMLQTEVTKLKTRVLLSNHKLQKISENSKNSQILTSSNSSLRRQTSLQNIEKESKFVSQSYQNLSNTGSNKMEIDRICTKISSLILAVKKS